MKELLIKKIAGKITFGIVFLILISVISIVSFYKLMKFYSTGEIDYNEWNASTESKFETDLISNFFYKYQYINLNGLVKKLLNQNEMNGVIKLNNGYLMKPNEYIPQELIEKRADNVQIFNEHLVEENIQYLYVTIPFVVDKYNSQIPIGVQDYGNINLDNYKKAIEFRDIQSLDLRDELYMDGMETYDIFYRTDHHWTTKGGFYGYQKIIEYLESICDFETDSEVKDFNNYSVYKYEEWHLGSNGQKTGKYFAGMDDFDLILPKFDTKIENWDRTKSGTMEAMLINKEPLQTKNYMSRYTYDLTMEASCANYHNPNASVDKTILIIGDSFSKAMNPYFILTFRDVLFVSNQETATITKEYMDTYQPDIVISAYYVTWADGDNAYAFNY